MSWIPLLFLSPVVLIVIMGIFVIARIAYRANREESADGDPQAGNWATLLSKRNRSKRDYMLRNTRFAKLGEYAEKYADAEYSGKQSGWKQKI
jgi:hypothetical protein